MGLNYPDMKDGWKHCSVYSKVIVRDVVTHEVLPAGKEGMLEFISPIPHSYPGNVILTDDLGVIDPNFTSNEVGGERFKVLGRIKKKCPPPKTLRLFPSKRKYRRLMQLLALTPLPKHAGSAAY